MENIIKIKGMDIIQDTDMLSVSLDSMLVADFVKINRHLKKLLDIGTGNGIIALLMAKKTKADVYAVEIQKRACELANKNFEKNNVNVKLYNQDIKEFMKDQMQVFDVIVSNPPYFEMDIKEQMKSTDTLKMARNELTLSMEELIKISSRLLKHMGHLYIIFRVDRIPEVFKYLDKYGMCPKHMKLVYTTDKKEAQMCLLDSVKSTSSKLHIHSPIYAYVNGEKSEYIKEIYL